MVLRRSGWPLALALLLALALALGLGAWGAQRAWGLSRDSASRPEATPPGREAVGGPGVEQGQVQENVEYIIRDARGRIKERKTVGGK
jgi:hypothetical protein